MKPGEHITPNIQLEHLIGEGAMSQVWSAHHTTLRRRVAVKFPSRQLASNREVISRFSVEARTIARIDDRHVPQVFDHGTLASGTPFIEMELLEGPSLERVLEARGTLSTAETNEVIAQLGGMLASAHALGIIHRDIKPDNIILVLGEPDRFTAKLLDFGLAKAPVGSEPGGITLTGMTLGTPHYMSPEQALDAQSVDAHADMWSLAVVAYRCLTGRLPFDGETLGAVFLALERGRFETPSALRRELTPSVDRWFTRAFARDPDARFASALEMARELAVATRTRSAWERATGSSSSHWFVQESGGLSRSIAGHVGRSGPRRAIHVSACIGALAALAVVAVSRLDAPWARATTARLIGMAGIDRTALVESDAVLDVDRALPPVAPFPFVEHVLRPPALARHRSSVPSALSQVRALPREISFAVGSLASPTDSTADDAYPAPSTSSGSGPSRQTRE